MEFNITETIQRLRGINPFLGAILQQIRIENINKLQAPAAVRFCDKKLQYIVMFNPSMMEKYSKKEQVAIAIHELYHISFNHLENLNELKELYKDDWNLLNIAMDCAINQHIQNLPRDCVSLDYVKQLCGNGVKVEANQGYNYYMKLLKKAKDKHDAKKKPGDNEFMEGSGETLDSHEGFKDVPKEIQDAMKEEYGKLVARANQACNGIGTDGNFTRALDNIKKNDVRLNAKRLLTESIRKSIVATNYSDSWARKNRYFGRKCPGLNFNKKPSIHIYFDTSGSIDDVTLGDYLGVLEKIFQEKVKYCKLSFWHTEVYETIQMKKGAKPSLFGQSGGTCLEDTIEHINKNNDDLNIIVTDGEYYAPSNAYKLRKDTIFLITENNSLDHPLKSFRTIQLNRS